MLLRAIVLHMSATAILGMAAAVAQERKPTVPSGLDPGGVAIALISTGIDYTLPAIASRLARDGEGELIGWDLEDKDRRPFDRQRGTAPPESGGDGTIVASLLLSAPGVRLVPVRVDPVTPLSLARALAFVAQTPARIAVMPMAAGAEGDWTPFRQAATHFKDVLIIVPAGAGPAAVFAGALLPENVLVLVNGTISADAAGFGGTARRVVGIPVAISAAARAAATMMARQTGSAGAVRKDLSETGGSPVWHAQK